MKRDVFRITEDSIIEQDVAYLLDKMDYMLRKVANYDKALNEFSVIKNTIQESEEHTRKSKEIVRETKDTLNIHATDINTIIRIIASIGDRFDHKIEDLNKKVSDLSDRLNHDKNNLEAKIEIGLQGIKNLLLNSIAKEKQDFEKDMGDQKKWFESMISNVHNNHFIIGEKVAKLNQFSSEWDKYKDDFHKRLCCFQNALVRKGVAVD